MQYHMEEKTNSLIKYVENIVLLFKYLLLSVI